MRGGAKKLVQIRAVQDHPRLGCRYPSILDEELPGCLRDQHDTPDPRQRRPEDQVRFLVRRFRGNCRSSRFVHKTKFPAMTGVDNHRDPGQRTGKYAIMMDQMIMRMHHVRSVAPQLLYDLPNGAEMRPRRFLKRPHSNSPCRRLRRNPAGMSQAIDKRLMTLRQLAIGQVNGQSFQAAHIEIVYKLYDSHGVQQPPFFHPAGAWFALARRMCKGRWLDFRCYMVSSHRVNATSESRLGG